MKRRRKKYEKKIERVKIDGLTIFCCPLSISSIYYCALKTPTAPQFLSTENKTNQISFVKVLFSFYSVEPSEPWRIGQKFHLMRMNYIPGTFRA